MTETSRVWGGTITGDAASAPYDEDEWSEVWRTIYAQNSANLGVLHNVTNVLAVSGSSSPVTVATGMALVHGTWYNSDASATVTIPTPSASARIDRIVLQKHWSNKTTRITRRSGAEAATPAGPSLSQTSGTIWEIPLAAASVSTAGVITLVDEREYVRFSGKASPADLYTSTEAQGDILYHNGTTWANLAAGTSGYLLKTQGASSNPIWFSAASSFDGLTGTSIAGRAQGDTIYFNGSNWVNLGAGTSGWFLKAQGAGANPVWAESAGGGFASKSATTAQLTADKTLTDNSSGIQYLGPNGASRIISLPTASATNPSFFIYNSGSSGDILSVRQGSSQVALLTSEQSSEFLSNGVTWTALKTSGGRNIYQSFTTSGSSTTAFNTTFNLNHQAEAQVFVDGLFQGTANWTLTNASTVTLSAAPAASATVVIVKTGHSEVGAPTTVLETPSGTINGSNLTFIMSNAASSVNEVLVFVDGIFQDQTKYTVSATSLVFGSGNAPPTSSTLNICRISDNFSVGTPSDATVTAAKFATTAISGATALSASPTLTDQLLVSDSSASAIKSMTIANVLKPTSYTALGGSAALDDTLLLSDHSASSAIKSITVQNLISPASYNNLDAVPAATDEVLLSDAGVLKAVTVSNLTSGTGLFTNYAIIADQKANNTASGTFTSGAWQMRDLNHEIADAGSMVSISANVFTLAAGNYMIKWSAPAYQVETHQTRLYNSTASAVVEYGSSEFAEDTAGGITQSRSFGSARTEITGSTHFKLQHRCGTTVSTSGYGERSNFGNILYYSMLEIYKEA